MGSRRRGRPVRGFRSRPTSGGLRQVDLLGDDLAAVAVVPHAVDPLGVVDAAVDEDFHALFAVLRSHLAEAVEAGNAVPFGVHEPVAVLVRSTRPSERRGREVARLKLVNQVAAWLVRTSKG